MLPFVLSVVDPASARSERGEENTERAALLPYPGFRSVLMMVRFGIGLWVYETLVVRFCACAVSLNKCMGG